MEGYPVLTDDARRKLLNLLREASEEDRPLLQKAILDMAQRASIAGTDSRSDRVGDFST